MGVVIEPVDDRRPGYGSLVNVGPSQHRQGRHVAAERPAIDPDAVQVQLVILGAEGLQPVNLTVEGHAAEFLADGPLPVAAPAGCAAVIDGNYHEPLVG